MRNFFSLSVLPVIFTVALLFNGCRTVQPEKTSQPKKINLEERIKNAEAVKKSLLKHLEHPKTVNETVQIKEELDKVQNELEELKSGKDVPPVKEDEGFKNVKDKTVFYGPVGLILKSTQWVLEKLYILN